MKLLALLSIMAGIGMIVLLYVFYMPMLNSPTATVADWILLGSTLLLQLFLLFFSAYTGFKRKETVLTSIHGKNGKTL